MKARNLFFAFVAIVFVRHARADDCGPGYYYNDNNECVACQNNHYCTGDGTMQPCPDFTYDDIEDVYSLVTSYSVHSIKNIKLFNQYVYAGYQMINITNCLLMLEDVETDEGTMWGYFIRYDSNNNKYDQPYMTRWKTANTGYYLSNPTNAIQERYTNIKPCTNAPSNAHYTGAGTNDTYDGTIVDANDCPWECDSGYGQTDSGACLQLCQAGVTEFHAGDLMFNIYANKQTTPSINIKYNDTTCYVSLATGSTTNALHVKYQDTTYHTIN